MNATHPHTMQTCSDGRIRAVYLDPKTGRRYVIIDGKRRYKF